MLLKQQLKILSTLSIILFLTSCNYPRVTNEIIFEGNQFYQRQEYQNALKKYLQAYKQEPNNLAVLNNLGVTYSVLSKDNLAIEFLKKAIATDKKDSIAHYTLASIYLKQNNLKDALEEALTAKNINNKDSQIFEILGNIYMSLKDYPQAIDAYSRLNDLEPYEASYHVLLAKAYYFNKQSDEAIKYFTKALELDSDSKEAAQWLKKCQAELSNEATENDETK